MPIENADRIRMQRLVIAMMRGDSAQMMMILAADPDYFGDWDAAQRLILLLTEKVVALLGESKDRRQVIAELEQRLAEESPSRDD